MGLIDYIDGENRDIYLSIESLGVDIHPIDIYKEMRTLRKNDEELRKYDVFLSAYGNVYKGNGKYTERYVMCNSGTRIIPYNTTHSLKIIGTIITDDGKEGIECFDRSTLDDTSLVDINYMPPQVEVITVDISGSNVTETDMDNIATKVWNFNVSNLTSESSIGFYILNKILTTLKYIAFK